MTLARLDLVLFFLAKPSACDHPFLSRKGQGLFYGEVNMSGDDEGDQRRVLITKKYSSFTSFFNIKKKKKTGWLIRRS